MRGHKARVTGSFLPPLQNFGYNCRKMVQSKQQGLHDTVSVNNALELFDGMSNLGIERLLRG